MGSPGTHPVCHHAAPACTGVPSRRRCERVTAQFTSVTSVTPLSPVDTEVTSVTRFQCRKGGNLETQPRAAPRGRLRTDDGARRDRRLHRPLARRHARGRVEREVRVPGARAQPKALAFRPAPSRSSPPGDGGPGHLRRRPGDTVFGIAQRSGCARPTCWRGTASLVERHPGGSLVSFSLPAATPCRRVRLLASVRGRARCSRLNGLALGVIHPARYCARRARRRRAAPAPPAPAAPAARAAAATPSAAGDTISGDRAEVRHHRAGGARRQRPRAGPPSSTRARPSRSRAPASAPPRPAARRAAGPAAARPRRARRGLAHTVGRRRHDHRHRQQVRHDDRRRCSTRTG